MEIKYKSNANVEITLSSEPSSLRLYEIVGLDGLSNTIFTTKSPNQDGYTVNSKNLKERPISLVGKIITSNKEEMKNLKRKLLYTFNPKFKGSVYIDDLYIDVEVSNAPVFTYTSHNILSFIIELIAPNPYLKTINESKAEIAKWQNGFHFPLFFREEGEIIGYREPSLITNIFNSGDVEAPIRIEFVARGNVSKPSIINVNTKEFIKINKNMVDGEKIIITTGFNNKKVIRELNGLTSNAFHYINLNTTFIQLDVGDNLIKYDAEEGIDNLEVTIYHTPLYVGV